MSKIRTFYIARAGLLAALAVVAICIFRIPGPDGKLYFHLGETVILTSAVLLGRREGALIAAISSALADLLLGATLWAPFSFVIHGAEAWIVGSISDAMGGRRDFLAMLAGVCVMIAGYAFMAGCLYGIAVVWVEIFGDAMQGLLGISTAFPFVRLARRRFPWIMDERERRQRT